MSSDAPTRQTNAPWDSIEFNRQTRATVLNRVYFFDHGGVEILMVDLSNGDPVLGKMVASECLHQVKLRPLNSVRTLTNIEGVNFDKELAAIGQSLAEQDKPYVRKSAVTGVSGLRYVLFESIVSLTRRDFKVFKTKEEALEWLVVE